MKIPFRQGIVRQQLTDLTNQPNFLTFGSSGNVIEIYSSPDPTTIAISHGTVDYLYEEASTITAWTGPFLSTKTYYLYWDIDILTGLRTFGKTERPPVTAAAAPLSPQLDQHWYDLSKNVYRVWGGSSWVDKLRCFAGHVSGGSLITQYSVGTQVGINTSTYAGLIVFDDDQRPIKKFDRFNRGHFITTETNISSQSPRIANFKIESAMFEGKAIEPIPKWSVVCYKGQNLLGLASYLDTAHPAVGIAVEDMFATEVRGFSTSGFLTDHNWNWTVPPSTPLFVGTSGQLTLAPPQQFSMQIVAYVVAKHRIFVDVQPQMIYGDA